MKTYEKKEYEPKKVGSEFWWGTMLWCMVYYLILWIVGSFGAYFLNVKLVEIFFSSDMSYPELMNKVDVIGNIASCIGFVIGVLLVFLAQKMAMKKISKLAILKPEMEDGIMKKYKTNTFILLGICVVLNILTIGAEGTTVIDTVISVAGFVISTIIEIWLAKKVLVKAILNENSNSNFVESI